MVLQVCDVPFFANRRMHLPLDNINAGSSTSNISIVLSNRPYPKNLQTWRGTKEGSQPIVLVVCPDKRDVG
jgi:hypothetical protein